MNPGANIPASPLDGVAVAELFEELDQWIDPSTVKVALDVGSRDAHVAGALKDHFGGANVYAFECNPSAVELCRRNIAGRPGITLVERAVSDAEGTVDFFPIDIERTVTPHADGNIGASSLFRANPEYPYEKYVQQQIQVQAITLEGWAREAGVSHVDLIWMDLQGAELKALMGLGDLIHRVKFIYTEVEFKPQYVGQPLFPEIDAYLRSHGFRLARRFHASDWFGDVLYVRGDVRPRRWFRRAIVSAFGRLRAAGRRVRGVGKAFKRRQG